MLRQEDFEDPDRWIRFKTKYEREGRLKNLQHLLLKQANQEENAPRQVFIWSRIAEICSSREYLRYLAKSSWKKGTPTLLSYLTNTLTPKETLDTFHRLGKEGDLMALHLLQFFLQESGMEEQALEALLDISPRQSKELILKGLLAKSPGLRRQCIQILSTWASQEALVLLIRCLEDEEKEIRLQVMSLLMNFEEQQVVLPLILRLQDKESEIREKAAFYLGILGHSQAIRPLTEALEKEDHRSVCYQMKASLEIIKGKIR